MFIIIILAGVPGVGKSSIAAKLTSELGINLYTQVELLREVMRMYESDQLIHKNALNAWEVIGENTLENVAKGFDLHTLKIQKSIITCIMFANRLQATLLLDGVSISPALISALPPELQQSIKMVLLTCQNETVHKDRLLKKIGQNNNDSELNTWLLNNYKTSRLLQIHLIKEYKKRNLPIIENNTIETTVEKIIQLVKASPGSI